VYVVVVKKFTFAISSADEFLVHTDVRKMIQKISSLLEAVVYKQISFCQGSRMFASFRGDTCTCLKNVPPSCDDNLV